MSHLNKRREELIAEIRELEAERDQLLALQPPAPTPGRYRQGTKNGMNLYIHQGDDQVGQPVGVMRSAELAAFVATACNALCAGQAPGTWTAEEDG